jgi:signal transduction histidine kinase
MKDTAATLLEGCRYTLGFPNESVGRRVDLEWRQHVYLIFKEALTNIAKHACATNVSIGVAVEGDNLAITIEDDGKGFGPASPTGGSGLKNMRDRADLLHAQFSVNSTPCGGTRIMLKTRIA